MLQCMYMCILWQFVVIVVAFDNDVGRTIRHMWKVTHLFEWIGKIDGIYAAQWFVLRLLHTYIHIQTHIHENKNDNSCPPLLLCNVNLINAFQIGDEMRQKKNTRIWLFHIFPSAQIIIIKRKARIIFLSTERGLGQKKSELSDFCEIAMIRISFQWIVDMVCCLVDVLIVFVYVIFFLSYFSLALLSFFSEKKFEHLFMHFGSVVFIYELVVCVARSLTLGFTKKKRAPHSNRWSETYFCFVSLFAVGPAKTTMPTTLTKKCPKKHQRSYNMVLKTNNA